MSNHSTAQVNILYTRQNKYLSKILLPLLAISNIMFFSAAHAQNSAPSSSDTVPDSFSNQPNDIRPIQQPGSFFDSNNNGSRQFFQQGREQLYFLPDKKSEPILQVDENITEETEVEQQEAENRE